jgi:glycosyltransferase involved in cell wall biosynthesis
MNEIEILLVNDLSQDNSSKIIEEMAIEDPRIKIINNKKNMGTLFSRCIGTLMAKGKYIFPLDNDDLFLDYDVFDVVFKNLENGNYDIIGFKAIHGHNYRKLHISELTDDYLHDHPNNLILHQPELGAYSITKNNKFFLNDIHIWGKCINKEIYIKAINKLGKERYSYFISWAEDTAMIFILFNIANSYKFISKYGIFHLVSKNTSSFTQSSDSKTFGEIYLLDILFDFSRNNFETKKYIVDKALEIKNYEFFKIKNETNKNYMKIVLEKMMKCKYISNEDKYKLKQYFNEINFII